MEKILTLLSLLIGISLFSQVGINTENPNSTLEVVASPLDLTKIDGIIPPKIKGVELKSKDHLYGSAQTGAIVYVTTPLTSSTISDKTKDILSIGYYYFDGNFWTKLNSSNQSGDTTPDAFIDDNANSMVKLGTKSDGTSRAVGSDFVVKDNGNVGVGTSSPVQKLDVNGNGAFANTNANSSNLTLYRENSGTNLLSE